MAELPDDISPFQIGTEGIYNHVHFALIGRVRMAWEDGGWNEWFMWFDDGKKGWLSEAEGFLAISFESDALKQAQDHHLVWAQNYLHLGQKDIEINRQSFSVADLKKAECVTCEGELPSVLKQGQKTFTADLIGAQGQFASIDCDASWRPQECTIGAYVEFNALNFSHLRELPGWKKSPAMPPNKTGGQS